MFEQDLIEINPSFDSGGQLFRQQIVSYKSYEEGIYQGARGVVNKDDESCDVLRYIVSANPRWVDRPCGEPAWIGEVKPPPVPEKKVVVLTEAELNYQAQLERSARLSAPYQRGRFRN